MIREVHKIVSDWNDWYDKYVVYYVSGRKREYFGNDLPKSVKEFITDDMTEMRYVIPGHYLRYYRR